MSRCGCKCKVKNNNWNQGYEENVKGRGFFAFNRQKKENMV